MEILYFFIYSNSLEKLIKKSYEVQIMCLMVEIMGKSGWKRVFECFFKKL